MKKIVLSSLITMMLFFGGTADAMVGAALVPPAGGSVAFVLLIGFSAGVLGQEVGKAVAEKTESSFAGVIVALGLAFVVLDENRQVIEFKPITPANASEHGLTETEVDVYNNELARINLVSDEFTKWYNENENDNDNDKVMTQEEAKVVYNQVATAAHLSQEARNAVFKLVAHAYHAYHAYQSK